MATEERMAFNIEEFCRQFGIGRTTVYREIKGGRLAAVKVGKRTMITRKACEKWLELLEAERLKASKGGSDAE